MANIRLEDFEDPDPFGKTGDAGDCKLQQCRRRLDLVPQRLPFGFKGREVVDPPVALQPLEPPSPQRRHGWKASRFDVDQQYLTRRIALEAIRLWCACVPGATVYL